MLHTYICMCALSHTCMLIHIQKCPVTLIMNPVPPVVCKEIDSYPSYSHNDMTRYTWMPIVVCVCVCSPMESDYSKLLMWVWPAATEAKGELGGHSGGFKVKWEVGEGHKQVIVWRECRLTWLQHTRIKVGKGQNGFAHLSASPLTPRSQPENLERSVLIQGSCKLGPV